VSELKHTPGPWETKPTLLCDAVRIFSGDIYLAAVTNSDFTLKQNQANANLIAAAPDLLEALERVQRKFYPANQREQNRDFTWHIVNKAIAKAKGEL
jgi:hypothetical protein